MIAKRRWSDIFFSVISAIQEPKPQLPLPLLHCILFYVIWAVLPDLNKWMDGWMEFSCSQLTDSYFIKAWNGFHSDIVFFYCYCFSG